jgi:tetratricopeptide (TPR) repeat protein
MSKMSDLLRKLRRLNQEATAGPSNPANAAGGYGSLTNVQFRNLDADGDVVAQAATASGAFSTVVQSANNAGTINVFTTQKWMLRPRQLPPAPPNFVGRAKALEELDRLSVSGGSTTVISAIDGMGGVGKTATVLHWAHSRRHQFSDGDLYVDLHGFDFREPVDPATALIGFVRALGYPMAETPSSLGELSTLFRTLVHDREMLLVLDNANSSAQVEPLLATGTRLTTVVTSRNRLAELKMRTGLKTITLPPLPLDEAVQLLSGIAGAGRSAFDPDATAQLARDCGFLPLALQIVGDRLLRRPSLSIADASRQISNGVSLTTLKAPERQTSSIEDVLEWSYRWLDERQARTLRLLGLPNSADFSLGAASALVGENLDTVTANIDSLVGASLVNEKASGRFSFHDLMRRYVRSKVDSEESSDARRAAIQRMCEWYLGMGTIASKALMPERVLPQQIVDATPDEETIYDYESAMRWCEAERESFVAAIQDAAEYGLNSVCWRMTVCMRGFYNIRKYWQDWEATHSIALESALGDGDVLAEAHVVNGLGTLMRQTHRPAQAVQYHRRAYEIRSSLNDLFGAATALDGMGAALLDQRAFDDAEECFKQALALGTEVASAHKRGWSLSNLGELELARGRFAEARNYLLESLEVRRLVSDPWGEGRTRHFLGKVALDAGDHEMASELLAQSAEFRREIGDTWGCAWSLALRSEACAESDPKLANSLINESIALLDSIHDPDADLLRMRLKAVG